MVSSWKRVLVWQGLAVVFGVLCLLVVGAISMGYVAVEASPLDLFKALGWIGLSLIVPALLLVPITFPALVLWSHLAVRWPEAERSHIIFLAGMALISLVISVAAAAANSWSTASLSEPFLTELFRWTWVIFPGVFVGIVLPRLLVDSLNLGCFAAEAKSQT
jgi:hypothetical protein